MSIRPGATVTKDPDANLVYTWDWSSWLVSPAQISSAVFVIDDNPDGALTLSNDSNTTTTAQVRINGGTAGKTYKVRCRIVTNESPAQTDDRSIYVRGMAQ